ncbi:MerR family transcriptional regulator [Actinomycetota bacterium]
MPNKEQKKYTIDDLSELTGYSRRTIRYYIQEGLLDPPAGRGKGGFYFGHHLSQLQLIKQLQDKKMSLSSISKYMNRDHEPRKKFYDEYKNSSLNYEMSEKAFPAAEQRVKNMKMKMGKSPKKERLEVYEKKVYEEDSMPNKGFYAPSPESPRDVWIKYEISPGLEINIKRDIEEKQKRKIDDIIRVAREILGKY